jgi:hypothetical protein
LFFPQETRKKSSEKKRETQTIPAFTIPLHTLLCQGFEICLYNKPETKINQMKSLKLLPKA